MVEARDHLVVVTTGRAGCSEIVGHRACVGRRGPQVQQFRGSAIDPVRRNDVVQEWRGSGGAPRASPFRVHDSSTRVVNLVDHNRLAACVHASIVANTRREPRLAYFRKITRSFHRVGNRGCEWLARPQPEAFRAEEPKRFVSPTKVRNVQGPAGICSELVLHPLGSRLLAGTQKEIVGIEDLVAKVFIRFAVDGACAGFGAEIGYSTGKLAPLRP